MILLLLAITFLVLWPTVTAVKNGLGASVASSAGRLEDAVETTVMNALSTLSVVVIASHIGWCRYSLAPMLVAWATVLTGATLLARYAIRRQRHRSAVESPEDSASTHADARRSPSSAPGSTVSNRAGAAETARFDPFVLLALPIAAIAILLLVRALATAYATEPFAWDELSYHLPAPRAWVDAGRLGARGFAVSDPYAYSHYYPANMGLLHGWSMLLGGGHVWAEFGQIYLWVTASLAMWLACRVADVGRWASLIPVGVLLALPILAPQMATGYSDLAAGCLVALTLFGLLVTVRSFEEGRPTQMRVWCVFSTASGGLAIGTKANTLVVVAAALTIVSLLALASSWRGTCRSRRREVVGSAGFISALLLVALALGGFWYVRNLFNFGNPVFPFAMSLGPLQFEGPLPADTVRWLPHQPSEYSSMPVWKTIAWNWIHDVRFPASRPIQYDERLGTWGMMWPVLVASMVAFFIGGLAAIARAPRSAGASRPWRALVPVVGVALLGLATLPASWWSRYAIGYIVVSALPVAWAVDRLDGRARLVVAVAILAALAPGMLRSLGQADQIIPSWATLSTDPHDAETQHFYQWTYDLAPGTVVWAVIDGSKPDWPYLFYGRGGGALEPVAVDANRIATLREGGGAGSPDVVAVQKGRRAADTAASLARDGFLVKIAQSQRSCEAASAHTCWLVYRFVDAKNGAR